MATIPTHPQSFSEDRGIKEILGDLYRNSKQVAQQEIVIIKEETKAVGKKSIVHASLLAGFSLLAVLSIFPLLAFFVIALGQAMDGNYWASSLIVGVLFLIIGGGVAYWALTKLKEDFHFPQSQATVKRLLRFFEAESTKLKNTEVFSNGQTHLNN